MTGSIEKRLKRQVIGKPYLFFVMTAPGVEELTRSELVALGIEGHVVSGGVEFTGRLHEGYRANLHLRTAGRILMRLHSFATTHFSELEQEAAEIPWELYLKPGTLGRIQVATHHCRLHHTDGIAERVRLGVAKRLPSAPAEGADPQAAQRVYVRGVDDRFTISLDSSGNHLHLRGIKTHPGRAPLRETIAAAALIRAGFTGLEPLVDPMCGTGTFALEAALIAKGIPPGWFREFAFMGWPAFRPPRWAHLRRTAGERIASLPHPRIFASDIDPDACRALGEGLPANGLADAVRVQAGDFFQLNPHELPVSGPGLIVVNPPYGRRLGTPSESRRLVQSILARMSDRFEGWRFVLVAPASVRPAGLPPGTESHPVFHGGLNVQFWIGKIASG
jgi:putative N6-adenine-specific DNA methylase